MAWGFGWKTIGRFDDDGDAEDWCRRHGIALVDAKFTPAGERTELSVRSSVLSDEQTTNTNRGFW